MAATVRSKCRIRWFTRLSNPDNSFPTFLNFISNLEFNFGQIVRVIVQSNSAKHKYPPEFKHRLDCGESARFYGSREVAWVKLRQWSNSESRFGKWFRLGFELRKYFLVDQAFGYWVRVSIIVPEEADTPAVNKNTKQRSNTRNCQHLCWSLFQSQQT